MPEGGESEHVCTKFHGADACSTEKSMPSTLSLRKTWNEVTGELCERNTTNDATRRVSKRDHMISSPLYGRRRGSFTARPLFPSALHVDHDLLTTKADSTERCARRRRRSLPAPRPLSARSSSSTGNHLLSSSTPTNSPSHGLGSG